MNYLALSFVLFLLAILPVKAHEGSAGAHLILGVDVGLAVGIVLGFLLAIGLFAVMRKRSRQD
ncbi:MAG: hypothetical protein IPM23_11080 [Candidatus Melainabacteria bacterium]|nr:hypothetical protein [Candidatus Melainabacteria bacterium]